MIRYLRESDPDGTRRAELGDKAIEVEYLLYAPNQVPKDFTSILLWGEKVERAYPYEAGYGAGRFGEQPHAPEEDYRRAYHSRQPPVPIPAPAPAALPPLDPELIRSIMPPYQPPPPPYPPRRDPYYRPYPRPPGYGDYQYPAPPAYSQYSGPERYYPQPGYPEPGRRPYYPAEPYSPSRPYQPEAPTASYYRGESAAPIPPNPAAAQGYVSGPVNLEQYYNPGAYVPPPIPKYQPEAPAAAGPTKSPREGRKNAIEDMYEQVWSGFFTRSKLHRVGVDAYLVSGNVADHLTDYNLNISHRTTLEEAAKVSSAVVGVVAFTSQNETQNVLFGGYVDYFSGKERVLRVMCNYGNRSDSSTSGTTS